MQEYTKVQVLNWPLKCINIGFRILPFCNPKCIEEKRMKDFLFLVFNLVLKLIKIKTHAQNYLPRERLVPFPPHPFHYEHSRK